MCEDDAREWSNSTTDGSDGDRTPATTTIPARAAADELRAVDDDVGSGPGSTAVSYTHLTLPTIYSV